MQELRTPVAVRSMLRVYTTLIVPLLVGPYWSGVAKETGETGFAVVFALLVRRAACPLPAPLNLSPTPPKTNSTRPHAP